MGSPARHCGWVSRAGGKLDFEQDRAQCPQTGERYRFLAGRVVWDG
jgi:hypothetical protein